MSRDDIHKLLGGYATGTLTREEQQALFEAALTDQELFDALAREQPLRDLLRDPAATAEILLALEERPSRWYRGWGWWRPATAVVAMAGLAGVAAVVGLRYVRAPEPAIVAQVSPPAETPLEPRRAPASPVEVDRPAAPVRRKAQPLPRRAALPTVTAKRQEAPADTAPADMASGLQDSARGRSVGALGAFGGGMGGVPGGAPQAAAPPTPATSPLPAPAPTPAPKMEAQTTARDLSAAPIVTARSLFYESPIVSQSFAPKQAKEAESASAPAPAGQQQPVPQNQALKKTSLAVAADVLREQQATNPGIRYRILRQADTAGLTTAATITVAFTPNASGILSVTSGGRALISGPVARLATYTTEPLNPGDRELTVVFSRTVPMAITGAVALRAREAAGSNVLHRSDDADGTYVVGEPGSPELHFTIGLNGQ